MGILSRNVILKILKGCLVWFTYIQLTPFITDNVCHPDSPDTLLHINIKMSGRDYPLSLEEQQQKCGSWPTSQLKVSLSSSEVSSLEACRKRVAPPSRVCETGHRLPKLWQGVCFAFSPSVTVSQ